MAVDGSMVESTGFGDAPSGFEEDEDMASNLESMSAPTEQIVEAQAEEPYDFGGPTDTTIATEHAIHEEQSEPQPAAQVSGSEGVGLMDRITEIGAEILSTGQELEQTTKEIEQIERNIDNIMLKFRQSGYNIALLTAELSTPGEKRRTLTEKKEALTKKRDSLIIELQALLLGGQPVCVAQEDNKQDLHAAQEADLRDLHTDQKNVHDLHAGQENNVHKLLAAQENDVNEQPTVEPPPATPEQTLIEFSPERKPEGVKPLLQMKPLEGKFLGLEISSHYDPKFEPPKVYYPKPAEARIGPHNDLGARRHILEGEAKREAATRHGLDQLASQTPPATRECSVSEIQSMEPKQTMAPKTLFDDFQGEKAMPAKKPHGTQKATTKPAAAARLTHYDATVHGQQGSSLSTRVSATRGSTHKPSAVPESVALASGDLGINMKAEEAQPLISLDQKSVEQSKSRPPTTAGRPPLQATTAQASQHQAGSRPIPKAPNVAAGEGWTWEHVKLLGAGWIDSRADNTEETTRVGHAKKAEPSRSAGSQSVPPHLRSKDAPPASQSRPLQDVSTNKIVESPNTLGGATTYHPPPLVRSKAPTLSSPPENSMNKLPSRSTPYIPDSAMARQYGQEPKTEVATSKLPSQMVPNLPDNAITRQYAGVRSLPPHQRSAVQPGQAQSSQPPAAPLARTLDVPNIPFSAATRQYAARRDPIADVSAQMSKLHLRESAQGSENVPPRSQRRDNTFGLGASSHAPAAQTGNSRNRRGSVESDLMDFESDAAVRPSTASDDERERIMNLSTDDMFKRPLLTKSRIILPDFVDSKPDLKDPGAAARKQYMKG